MTRFLTTMLLPLLLAPYFLMTQDYATPPATSQVLADPIAVNDAVRDASPPSELPGIGDEELELVTWVEHHGEELAGAVGSWVITGSPQFPIAMLMIFESPESARAGIEPYAQEPNRDTAGELEVWTIADRGKWVCVTADGPVVIFGQAEPQPDESDDDVRQRSCAIVLEMHHWLTDQILADGAATPPGTAAP